MSEDRVSVVVDDETVLVWPWATWKDAVTAHDPDAGSALSFGDGVIRDPAGQLVDPDGHVVAGAHIHFRRLAGKEERRL